MATKKSIKIGDKVRTLKGSRKTGPFKGTVVRFSKYMDKRAVIVKKNRALPNGMKTVLCLVKNIEVI